MEACHAFWSEPNRLRNRGEIRFPEDEQLTAILSALEWKRHSGPVRMLTDTAGAAFFQKIGLTPFWDGTEAVLDGLGESIDPLAFWAAGKLRALRAMPVPCAMLDTDLIVWENVESRLSGDAVAAHAEALNPRTYPDPSRFPLEEGYAFPENWDFSLPAANTAFLYFRDAALRNAWLDEAFDFMRHVRTEGLNPVQTMCFAEQRILPMCAGENGKTLGYLMKPEEVLTQQFVTHTWGFKQVLRRSEAARDAFCMRCVRRIHLDFPRAAELLDGCTDLRDYARRYREAKATPEEKR